MSKSLTKIAATALTVALVAGTALAPTAASAKDGRNKSLAIGAIAGVLLGSALASRQADYPETRYRSYNDDGFRAYGEQRPVRFVGGYDDCFEKPIKRFDRYTGEFVTVGTKVVCR